MILGPSHSSTSGQQQMLREQEGQKLTSHGPSTSLSAPTDQNVSKQGTSQAKPRRGTISKGLSFSATSSEEAGRSDGPSPQPVVCLLGAGVNLPGITEDGDDQLQQQQYDRHHQQQHRQQQQPPAGLRQTPEKKILLPSLLMSARRRSSAINAGEIDLQIAGQDMKLPPPKLILQAERNSTSWKTPLQTLAERSMLDLSELEQEQSADVEVLKQVLQCHSTGIPLKIFKKVHLPGQRCAVPVFHCHVCLEVWQETGQVPDRCPYEKNLISGPEIQVNNTQFKYIKKIWNTHLRHKCRRVNENDLKLTLEELQKIAGPGGADVIGLIGDSDIYDSDFVSDVETELEFGSSDCEEDNVVLIQNKKLQEHQQKSDKRKPKKTKDERKKGGHRRKSLSSVSHDELDDYTDGSFEEEEDDISADHRSKKGQRSKHGGPHDKVHHGKKKHKKTRRGSHAGVSHDEIDDYTDRSFEEEEDDISADHRSKKGQRTKHGGPHDKVHHGKKKHKRTRRGSHAGDKGTHDDEEDEEEDSEEFLDGEEVDQHREKDIQKHSFHAKKRRGKRHKKGRRASDQNNITLHDGVDIEDHSNEEMSDDGQPQAKTKTLSGSFHSRKRKEKRTKEFQRVTDRNELNREKDDSSSKEVAESSAEDGGTAEKSKKSHKKQAAPRGKHKAGKKHKHGRKSSAEVDHGHADEKEELDNTSSDENDSHDEGGAEQTMKRGRKKNAESQIKHQGKKKRKEKQRRHRKGDAFILPGRPQSQLAGSYEEMLAGLIEDFENTEMDRDRAAMNEDNVHGIEGKFEVYENDTYRPTTTTDTQDDDASSRPTILPPNNTQGSAQGQRSRQVSRDYSSFPQEFYDSHARTGSSLLHSTVSGFAGESEPKRQQKPASSKPVIRNTAVKNKTGKPNTDRGHLKSNVFSKVKTEVGGSSVSNEPAQRRPSDPSSRARDQPDQPNTRGVQSRAGRRSSMGMSGKQSVPPSEQVLDANLVPTEDVPQRPASRNIQSSQQRRKSVSTPAAVPRALAKAHHSRQIENVGMRDKKGGTPDSQRTTSRLANTWPEAESAPNDTFRFSSGPRAPSSLSTGSTLTVSDSADTDTRNTEQGATTDEVRQSNMKSLVAPLPKLPARRRDSTKIPTAEVKPTINMTSTVQKGPPRDFVDQSTSSESSESDDELMDLLSPREKITIPDFGGLSNLSFTPAFTFSFYPNLPYPKPGGDTGKSRKQSSQSKPKPTKKNAKICTVPKDHDRITVEVARKPKTDITKLSTKMQNKVANLKPIAKFVKKPLPAIDKPKGKGKKAIDLPKKLPLKPIIKRGSKDAESPATAHSLRRAVLTRRKDVRSQQSMSSSSSSVHRDTNSHRRRSKHSSSSQRIIRHEQSGHTTRRKSQHSRTKHVGVPTSVVKLAYQHSKSGATIDADFRPYSGPIRKVKEKAHKDSIAKGGRAGFKIEIDPKALHEAESVVIRVTDFI